MGQVLDFAAPPHNARRPGFSRSYIDRLTR